MKPYKDPDEFIKALGAEEFQQRIDKAMNSFYFEIEVLERDFDLKDPEQKTRFYNEIAKKMLVFTEEIERNNYIEAIADRYNIGFDNLRKLVNRYGAQITVSQIESKERSGTGGKQKGREDGMKQSQKLLLTWLIEEPILFDKIKGIIAPNDFTE